MGTEPYSVIDEAGADLDVGVIYTHEDDLMPPLLSTLFASADSLSMRLILVDNASADGTERYESVFADTSVIRNSQRLGYAPNLNLILGEATAPYVLLLNTDMHFDPEIQCMEKMVRFMRRHPDCGVAGCRLYHADGSYAYPARRFQSLKTVAARRLHLQRLIPGEIGSYLYHDRDPHGQFDCDWLSGCFLMIRRAAYEEIGGFDCGFTKYFEDVDYCLRASLAGWKVMFNGDTHGYHLEQRSSKRLFSRDAWLHGRSYLRWLRKWGFDPRRHLRDEPQPKRKAA